MVANGHYASPYTDSLFSNPNSFTGEIIHTHTYRTPEKYMDKKVLVVGQGPSGQDIAVDLLPFASQVRLLGKRIVPGMPELVNQSVGWPAQLKESSIVTSQGDEIECDVIILASGYCYDFPFLPEGVVTVSTFG